MHMAALAAVGGSLCSLLAAQRLERPCDASPICWRTRIGHDPGNGEGGGGRGGGCGVFVADISQGGAEMDTGSRQGRR